MELRQLFEDSSAWGVLAERARALALQEESASAERGAASLSFRLGGSSYSLPATDVREVQPLGACTPLPAVPPFIVGLVNVRGRLIAAVDLRPLLGIAAGAPAPTAQLLIVAAGEGEVGLIADAVVSVRRHDAELSPAPMSAAGRSVAWVRGVDEELSIHIDPQALCADPALVVNAEAEG